MKLARCNQGHFYDADSYRACPHCKAQKAKEREKTGWLFRRDVQPEPQQEEQEQDQEQSQEAASAGHNVILQARPVVGWLVCVGGSYMGDAFALRAGDNFVGRSGSMDVVLTSDEMVAHENHARITYEPIQGIFYVYPGAANAVTAVNGQVLSEPCRAEDGNSVKLGGGVFVLKALCGDDFDWAQYY